MCVVGHGVKARVDILVVVLIITAAQGLRFLCVEQRCSFRGDAGKVTGQESRSESDLWLEYEQARTQPG